jgi:hypothetical protein
VITKSDELGTPGPAQLPPHLYNYLITDPACNTSTDAIRDAYADIDNYMSELAHVSNEIRNWVSTLEGGPQLLALAENMNLELKFSIISGLGCATAMGQEGKGNLLLGQWKPYRVLDPLFWAMELESERLHKPVKSEFVK